MSSWFTRRKNLGGKVGEGKKGDKLKSVERVGGVINPEVG